MLLALDTSSRWMGVALYDGAQVLYETVWYSPNYHTSQLAPVVSQALVHVGALVSDLKAVGVALGPGGFTGLRVGLALAKGIVLAGHLPLIGIPSLEGLVAAQIAIDNSHKPDCIVAVLQAGRERLAVGWYQLQNDRFVLSGDYEILVMSVLAERVVQYPHSILVCGELNDHDRRILAERIKSPLIASAIVGSTNVVSTADDLPRRDVLISSPAHSLRRPAYLAELAWKRWQSRDMDDPATLVPIYLH